MEAENLYKEFEPDANEILFGQKTLPNRPLTVREESKRKKIIMKLVDQKLKFKLIELMRHQVVAGKHNTDDDEPAMTIPTVGQTINNSQPSHSFTSYQSQPNWFPHSNFAQHQQADGNDWHQQQQYGQQPDWQSSIYPQQQYGTAWDASWNNNCSFQPPMNIQSNVRGNNQRFHLNSKPVKRKVTQNSNGKSVINDGAKMTKISTLTSVGEQSETVSSTLISINYNPPTNATSYTKYSHSPLKPRRRRRYGRTKELNKKIKPAGQEPGGKVVLRDTFGIRCVADITGATDGTGLWNEMNRLVASIFRKEVNQMEPLSSYEQKLQHKTLIEMSTNPDTLRSNGGVSQFINRIKIEETISKAKVILQQVHRSQPQVQCKFFEFKENLIKDLKTMNDGEVAAAVTANETANVQVIQTKINEVIGPLFSVDVDETKRNQFISELMVNPRALEASELITQATTDKMKVMREIKGILDEHMIVRPGKRFYIPVHRMIDVPFVVAVHEKSGRMSEENATILRDALTAKMDGVISPTKPKIIDPKHSKDDGSLVMVCANRKTFDLTKTILTNDFDGKWPGADLIVKPVHMKNPLAKSELKTVLLKFTEPQVSHFNHLMEQLKIDNPGLLARRWELHQPPSGQPTDPTECIYVGVDIESLAPIEQMNRVAVLFKSTVSFEICYDETQRNFLPDQSLLKQ